jgi:hypothetical protein
MALDFLSLLPSVASLYAAYKSSQPTQAEQMQMQDLSNQQYYAGQAADPNSPLMHAYTNANKSYLDSQYAGNINDLVNANRRETSLGRQPILDPERGAQTIYRAQQLGYQQNANTAQNEARTTLQNLSGTAGQGAQAVGGFYHPAVADQQTRQVQSGQLPVSTVQAGTNILQQLFGSGGSNNSIQSPRTAGQTVGGVPISSLTGNPDLYSGNYNAWGSGGFSGIPPLSVAGS